METRFKKVGVIGRFKPLHNGAAIMLEAVCEKAEEVTIGIGSSNKYNLRNPFTAKESEEMINLALTKFSNYKIVHIPDFAHHKKYRDGQKWKDCVLKKFGSLDCFVSSNEFVQDLLKDNYKLVYPTEIIPKEKHLPLRGAQVRYQIAISRNWKNLVPEAIANYLENKGLIDRFKEEFGLETLSMLANGYEINRDEDKQEEKLHTREV